MFEPIESAQIRQGNVDNSRSGIFAENAELMRRIGWAIVPAEGKKPIPAGFPKWRGAPSAKAVEGWAKKMPDADMVIIAGLTKTRTGTGIITIDADDAEAEAKALEIFGDTPCKTKTRQGKHFHYDGAGIDLGPLQSLRDCGLAIDVRHGKNGAAIIVAPPSRHENDRAFIYGWHGCDETALRHAPRFNVGALQTLRDKASQSQVACRPSKTLGNTTSLPPAAAPSPLTVPGSRGLSLNKWLVGQGGFCDTLDELLDVANTWNNNLADHGLIPLGESEVCSRTRQVWLKFESGELERRTGFRATATTDADEIRFLDSDSLRLLMLLRAEHAMRCKQGGTFVLVIEAMVAKRVFDSWSYRKYKIARDRLIELGLLRMVKAAKFRTPAEYVLGDRLITPSVYTASTGRRAAAGGQ